MSIIENEPFLNNTNEQSKIENPWRIYLNAMKAEYNSWRMKVDEIMAIHPAMQDWASPVIFPSDEVYYDYYFDGLSPEETATEMDERFNVYGW